LRRTERGKGRAANKKDDLSTELGKLRDQFSRGEDNVDSKFLVRDDRKTPAFWENGPGEEIGRHIEGEVEMAAE